MADVDAALDAGRPVVVEVDYSSSPGLQNHWVLIYARQAGDYLIHDPWPIPVEASASLVQRYGFAGSPAQIITSAVFYAGQAPMTLQSFSVVVDSDQDIANAGGLALRDAPLTGAVQMRIPPGATLQVLEPISSAMRKLGQFGQWLTVRTSDGHTGSVAAWLVHASAVASTPVVSGSDGQAPSTGATNDSGLAGVVQPPLLDPGALTSVMVRVVDTSDIARVGGLALRSAPVNGAIKARLPAGTLLYAGEPAAQALQKVGKANQWLSVTTAAGVQGYVAGWYVEAMPLPALPETMTSKLATSAPHLRRKS